jgi:hypothetical protein
MAAQSRSGGSALSTYFSLPEFQRGWHSFLAGEPYDYASSTRLYADGRNAAAESGLPCPARSRLRTKEQMTAYRACPALVRQWSTERALAQAEARRTASLRLRLHREGLSKIERRAKA